MLTLDEIKKRLEPMNLKAVAKETGISYNAIYRMAKGDTNPKYETVQKITKWIEDNR
jgi:predicted transcriptional regulator